MATHSIILAWRIPMDRGAWRATVHRVSKSHTQLKQLITQVRRSSLRCIITVKNQKQGRLLKELVTSCYKAIRRFVRRNFTGQKRDSACSALDNLCLTILKNHRDKGLMCLKKEAVIFFFFVFYISRTSTFNMKECLSH